MHDAAHRNRWIKCNGTCSYRNGSAIKTKRLNTLSGLMRISQSDRIVSMVINRPDSSTQSSQERIRFQPREVGNGIHTPSYSTRRRHRQIGSEEGGSHSTDAARSLTIVYWPMDPRSYRLPTLKSRLQRHRLDASDTSSYPNPSTSIRHAIAGTAAFSPNET